MAIAHLYDDVVSILQRCSGRPFSLVQVTLGVGLPFTVTKSRIEPPARTVRLCLKSASSSKVGASTISRGATGSVAELGSDEPTSFKAFTRNLKIRHFHKKLKIYKTMPMKKQYLSTHNYHYFIDR